MRARHLGVGVLVVGLAAAACGGGADGELEHPSILWISVDTLRADHMGCYGYFRDTTPNLDRFAEHAILFERAYATMATTLPSHASILTGRYPLEHGILANMVHGGRLFGWKNGLLSFAQVARDEGYTTAGFIGAAPLKYQTGINLGFDHWDQPEGRERTAGEVFAQVVPWVEEHAEERLFLFVHLYDPHWKHRAPEPFGSMFQDDPGLEAWLEERGVPDEAIRSQGVKVTETRKAIDGYCGEIRYVDDQIGAFIKRLDELGLWRDLIVIFASDHGEGLNQHSWASHGLVWDEQLRVPLMIRFPDGGRFPRRFESVVSLIDVFPTVLGRMRPFKTPLAQRFLEQASGVDVLAEGFVPRAVFAQRTGREVADDPGAMYALTTPEWKFIYEEDQPERLFDRTGADPHELVNLAAQDPELTARARAQLFESMLEQSRRGALFDEQGPSEDLDPTLLRELQELGYMGGTPDE